MNNFEGYQFQVRNASRDAIKGIKWFWLLKVMDKVKKMQIKKKWYGLEFFNWYSANFEKYS